MMRSVLSTLIALFLAAGPLAAQAEQERVLSSATAFFSADRDFAKAFRLADAAYRRLKSTEGAEFLRNLDAANAKAQEMVVDEVVHDALKAAAKQAGAHTVALFIGLMDIPEIYRMLKLDSKLISANTRSNLTNLVVLRPAARQLQMASASYNRALSSQTGSSDKGMVTIGAGRSRLEGECRPAWSGRSVVTVTIVQGGTRSRTTPACTKGHWSTPVAPASYSTPSVAYASISDG
jgi:hypothetical protein